jgi:hypothetical protein
LVCGIVACKGYGQAPAAPRKIYTNRPAFKLPLRVDENDRLRLQEVQLFVREGPGGQWTKKEAVSPTQKEFVFRPPHDGEYWFTVVTVDKDGRKNPADLAQEAPGLIVVVDRQPPDFEVHPVTSPSGQPLLQCDVHDANPDPSKTRLEYQTPEQMWQPLQPLPEQPNLFRVPDPGALRGVVRVTAADLAGNVVTREISLQTATGSPPADGGAVPALMETRQDKPPAPPQPAGLGRHLLNSTHTTLRYQVDEQGPSGISKVEVWMTRDEGQNWQRLCEDPNRRSPMEIDLPGDGIYGLKLVVSGGNGYSTPVPVRGDPPEIRVEVDTTKPAAELLAVRPGTDAGIFIITWTASDKNLKAEPIDLEYASRPEGPWMPIAKGQKNDGNYRWQAPRDISGEIYVRMHVSDEAGNTTTCLAPQALILDQSHPKGRILGLGAKDN